MTTLTDNDRRQVEELANLVEALGMGFAGRDQDDDDSEWNAAVYDFHGRATLRLYWTLARLGLLNGAQWYDEVGNPGRLYDLAEDLNSNNYEGRWIGDRYLGLPGTKELYDLAVVELARARIKPGSDKGRIWLAVQQTV